MKAKPTPPECPFDKKYPSALVKDDVHYMTLAYNLSLEAYRAGEVPVGAIIVKEGQIIGSGYNQVEKLNDATAHAEMIAITQAAGQTGDWRLEGATLYVTKEPCPMCAGALLLSRIGRVVYATPDPKMGGNGGAVAIHQIDRSYHKYESVQGPMSSECTEVIREFFRQQRQTGSE